MDASLAMYQAPRLVSNKYRTDVVRIATYSRVSTNHKEQIAALSNQVQWVEMLLKQNPNWVFIQSYVDEGKSGTQVSKRKAFNQMMQDAKEHKFDLIICRENSRFMRNVELMFTHIRTLKKYMVEIAFIQEGIFSFEPDAELKIGLMSTLSQEESRHISERVFAGQAVSRSNGKLFGTGNILGYDLVRSLDGESNTYSINEDQSETVKLIYHMYVENGLGARAIATELQRLGRKNASGIVKWSVDRVLRCLKNKVYAGYIAYNKSYTVDFIEHKRKEVKDMDQHIYVKGNFPAIISEEMYNKAQKIRNSKRRQVDGDKARGKCMSRDKWGSKLVCACQSSYKKFPWRVNKSGNKCYGYICYNIVNNKSKSFREANNLDSTGYCNAQAITDWKLEMMLIHILKRLWDNPKESVKVLVQEIADNYTEDNCIMDFDKAKLLREQSRINTRLETLLDMRLDGSIDNDSFNLKQSQLKDRLEQIESELRANEQIVVVEKTEDVSNAISKVTQVLDKTCELDQKEVAEELVDSLIRRITPSEDGGYKWYFKGENDDEESTFSEENYILYDNFTIDFDTARAHRKKYGNYLRKNQYKDLKIEVYVRK